MKNIILIGMPGCGKTTIGKILAAQLGLSFFDCDVEITKEQNMSISEIFDNYGEEYFRNLESQILELNIPKSGFVISTGGGIVERAENVELLRSNGIVIFINRPVEMILADIDTSNRPLLKDGNDKLAALYKKRIDIYKKACHIEVENTQALNDTVLKIIDEVKNNG